MSQQLLRYAALSDQTRERWQKLLDSDRRGITPRVRQLLLIVLEACDSHGPEVLQVRWHGGCLWFCCPQEDLAGLLDCSDRTVRAEFERLRSLECLASFPHPSKPNLIGYRIHLDALEALPETHTPDIDDIICAYASDEISATVSGQISGTVSGQISGTVSGLMNHDHERLIEFNDSKESSITHVHESCEPQANSQPGDSTETRRFDQITDTDVLAIAGYAIEVNGVLKHASIASRKRVQLEYFDDAYQNNHAARDELPLFAALFRCAARLHRKPEGDKLRVNTPASWIRTVWTNRHAKPMSRITNDDKATARELLQYETILTEMTSV